MTERIDIGTMLLKDGTRLPDSLVLCTEQYSPGWSAITGSSSAELDKKIDTAGWTFFYMAGEIHRRGFGLNDQSRTDRALVHVIDAVTSDDFNCLEITQIRRRSFLGLHYTSLIAHARHIQISRSLYKSIGIAATVWSGRHRRLQTRVPGLRTQPFAGKLPRSEETKAGHTLN